jgi:hypothetical protein
MLLNIKEMCKEMMLVNKNVDNVMNMKQTITLNQREEKGVKQLTEAKFKKIIIKKNPMM